jgi:hypothetical protein
MQFSVYITLQDLLLGLLWCLQKSSLMGENVQTLNIRNVLRIAVIVAHLLV